jgi:ATP-dependent Clp protease ATP-binding subunit ClpB
VSDAAATLVGNEGYDPVYGARPLKRAIQREILDPLSLEILKGHFGEGDHIQVGIRDGKIAFSKR